MNDKIECPECSGRGWGVWSCCTGHPVDLDVMMCSTCREHLGEEECEFCDGTGMIHESESPQHYVRERYVVLNPIKP